MNSSPKSEATIGKRSDFKRRPRDAYDTPLEAVLPLVPYVQLETRYYEPCAGRYQLCNHLNQFYYCSGASDSHPRHKRVFQKDALDLEISDIGSAKIFITNPPWDRTVLHPLIIKLISLAPTWLLLDADWAHTKQATPYLRLCTTIVPIGRVKWIAGSKNTGKENCCWYYFNKHHTDGTIFHGRR